MSRPSLPIALALAALLGVGAAGCANTPQPPDASGGGGSGTVPTGTAPATSSATPTQAPSSEPSTPVASSSSKKPSSSSKPTAISGQSKPWPGLPGPDGDLVLDTSGQDDGAAQWTRSYRTGGKDPRKLADGLQKEYESAGFEIKQQTNIPGTAGGGKVFTAQDDKYQVSVVVNMSSSDGSGVIGTTINVAEL